MSRARSIVGYTTLTLTAVAGFVASTQLTAPASARPSTVIPYTVVLNDTGILLLDAGNAPVPPSGITSAPAVLTVINRGSGAHALTITGPGVAGKHTASLAKDKSTKLSVTFQVGSYSLTDTTTHRSLRLAVTAPKIVQVAATGGTAKLISEAIECSLDTHLCTNAQGVVMNPGSA
jgi:hypothetical protein